ncbi:MAG TPA: protein kinase [Gemmatimonadales bacterium]|nr:protein kinase [Gemmatimonadales bacterium]
MTVPAPAKLQSALADRYRFGSILGAGGMATVYAAEDLKHKRRVAIKVMHPELSTSMGAERFLREVEIAAGLSHPHILAVYDSGEADGFLYYVMPLVEGETLTERIAREGKLPVREALRIAREAAEALGHAHARGIVHRDIKPGNILLMAGHALVADFGIARAAVQDGQQSLTRTGFAIGTPQYMSPEQATGATDIDARTDVYALGAVLYEMLAGTPPFSGPTAQAVLAKSLTEDPAPLETRVADLPPTVTRLVSQALARDAAARPADGAALAAGLDRAEDAARTPSGDVPSAIWPKARRRTRWPMLVGAVAVLALGGVAAQRYFSRPAAAVAGTRVAVLPFAFTGDSADAYLTDGIVEELRGRLSQTSNLVVIGTASAEEYRGSTKSGAEIAKELKADRLLMGRVQVAPGSTGARRVRVSAELVDGATGTIVWRDTFDADLTDVFELQTSLATRVSTALGTAMQAGSATALAEAPTRNAEAYRLYLSGTAARREGTVDDWQRPAGLFEQAVALDTAFVEAWGQLAITLATAPPSDRRRPEVEQRVRVAVERALALGPRNVMAHRAAAALARGIDDQPETAIQHLQQAIAIEPGNPEILAVLSNNLQLAGRPEEALATMQLAYERDPRSGLVVTNLVGLLMRQGNLQEATKHLPTVRALLPKNLDALSNAVWVYQLTGDTVAARKLLRTAKADIPITQIVAQLAGYSERTWLLDPADRDLVFRLTPTAFNEDRVWWASSLAIAAQQAGDLQRARAYADSGLAAVPEQLRRRSDDADLAAEHGVLLSYAGRKAEALRELDRAYSIATDPIQRTYFLQRRGHAKLLLGDEVGALTDLELAVKTGIPGTNKLIAVDPIFRSLRGNPRFQQIVTGTLAAPVD